MGIRVRIGWAGAVLFLILGLAVIFGIHGVAAAGKQPPGPDRFAIIVQKYTSYQWWLTSWENNKVVCTIYIDHEGLPTSGDILMACGQEIFDEWISTKPCSQDSECNGYYLHYIKSEQSQRKVGVEQPPPVVWVTLDGCIPYKSTFRCEELPTLVLIGEEPLQGEHITGLTGNADGKPFTCEPICQIDLVPTAANGLYLEFWATSSYGDSSVIFQARVRVTKSSDASDPAWYTDVLSTQWRGIPLAGCSQIWDTFPPIGGTSEWLATPQRPEDIATNVQYQYLTANLIKNNVVDTSNCEGGGLLLNGFANACGLELARPVANDWQNRFDSLIYSAAQKTGVSAHLLKNIFARESQFWPGALANNLEAGFGQMTEGGADTVLNWNSSFYEQFCPMVLEQSTCKNKIYPRPEDGWVGMGLDDVERSILRGALVQSVDAICPDCSMGIDLEKANSSIEVFAQTLLANCMQTGKVIEMNYGSSLSEAASYEDLWRFTLVDYNAGPGCLGLAVDQTRRVGEPLNWENLSSHLTPACQGAIDYVNDISRGVP